MHNNFLFFPNKECANIKGACIQGECHRKNLAPKSDLPATVYRALKKPCSDRESFTPQLAMDNVGRTVLREGCLYCGLSVFTTRESFSSLMATEYAQKKFPYRAEGSVTETKHGPIEEKPDKQHVTWHPYAHIAPETLFAPF